MVEMCVPLLVNAPHVYDDRTRTRGIDLGNHGLGVRVRSIGEGLIGTGVRECPRVVDRSQETSGVGAVTVGEVATCAARSAARAGLKTGGPGRPRHEAGRGWPARV